MPNPSNFQNHPNSLRCFDISGNFWLPKFSYDAIAGAIAGEIAGEIAVALAGAIKGAIEGAYSQY